MISCFFSGRDGTVQERSRKGQRVGSSRLVCSVRQSPGVPKFFFIPWVLDPGAESQVSLPGVFQQFLVIPVLSYRTK